MALRIKADRRWPGDADVRATDRCISRRRSSAILLKAGVTSRRSRDRSRAVTPVLRARAAVVRGSRWSLAAPSTTSGPHEAPARRGWTKARVARRVRCPGGEATEVAAHDVRDGGRRASAADRREPRDRRIWSRWKTCRVWDEMRPSSSVRRLRGLDALRPAARVLCYASCSFVAPTASASYSSRCTTSSATDGAWTSSRARRGRSTKRSVVASAVRLPSSTSNMRILRDGSGSICRASVSVEQRRVSGRGLLDGAPQALGAADRSRAAGDGESSRSVVVGSVPESVDREAAPTRARTKRDAVHGAACFVRGPSGAACQSEDQ